MKTNKIFKTVAVLLAVLFSGCSSDFLNTEPTGATISQKQYEENILSSEAHIRGLYKVMITYADHDVFGQKSIDIKTDLISSDMALTAVSYGWMSSQGMLQSSHRGSSFTYYLWSTYFYKIIKNCNLIIAQKGDADLANPSTSIESFKASYVGQAYAMRGYAYYCLSYLYSKNQSLEWPEYKSIAEGGKPIDFPCVPIYDENSPEAEAQPLASVGRVIEQAEGDLLLAVNYLKNYARPTLTYIDKDVAKALLAYLYLYKARVEGKSGMSSQALVSADAALTLCSDIINSGKYPILPYSAVTSTGFNNVSSQNWMWGQDITVETSTGLGTFWGQMDVYTYSYAWAGDVKAIDENLYKEITDNHPNDKRKEWWSQADKLAPTGKFYDNAKSKTSPDRLWLNDIVFMRSEELYLIAAEAAYLKGNYNIAADYLKILVEQRDKTAILPADATIQDQIYYNWRVEMWGEGRGYITMKRFDAARTRGSNHRYLPGETIGAEDSRVLFEIPSTEIKYNPHLHE
jgi:hypothetical protein